MPAARPGTASRIRPGSSRGVTSSVLGQQEEKPTILGATGRYVRVFPASVDVIDAEVGVTHVITITVLNTDKHSRRIKFIPPQKKEFVLHYTPSVPIAPGLELTAELAFRTDDNKDFHDQIVVQCESDKIVIPIHAYVPRATIEFDSFCNFGSLAPEHPSLHFLELLNVGLCNGEWRFIQEEFSPFKITPSSGLLSGVNGSHNSMSIKVEFKGSTSGVYRSVAQLEVNGVVTGQVLDMNVSVVRQALEMILPNGEGIVDKMQFGTLYYGEVKKYDCLLVNDGPEPSQFTISLAANSTSNPSENSEDFPFDVYPFEGLLQPFEQIPISVAFKPIRPQNKTGFKCKAKAPLDERQDFGFVAVVEAANHDQKSRVTLTGKAVRHAVSISHHEVRFGECMTNEHLDIIVTLKNQHEELPINFNIDRIVHFKTRPSSGRLLPLQSVNIVVSFAPNQMGQHKNTLKVVICNGLDVMPLTVFGVCGGEGLRKKLTGGPTKNFSDFKPTFTFVEPDAYVTSNAVKEPFMRQPAWEKFPPHLMDGKSDVTWSAGELARREDHKRAYDNYIRGTRRGPSAADAEAAAAKKAEREAHGDLTSIVHSQGFRPFAEGPDMGMEPYSGLAAPEPPLPKVVDPLWCPKPDQRSTASDIVQPRLMQLDEDRLFSHKFKPKPTQARELKDCKSPLSTSDLLRIATHPRSMDFGKVCVQSSAAKCFAISNDTQHHILVVITSDRPELARSGPTSQVVPPGATAGFDIVIFSELSQSITSTVSYTINGAHSYKFDVTAEIVPVMLKLNRTTLNFRFPSHVYDPYMTEVVTLFNPGNNRAEFLFHPAGAKFESFTPIPAKGTVEPLGSEDVKLTYMPCNQTRNEENLRLAIVGGEDIVLKCIGEVEEGKLSTKVKSIDFGTVAAGSVKRRLLPLKNIGNIDAVFTTEVPPGLPTITPSKGSITAGGSQDLQLTLRPSAKGKVEGTAVVVVRGGKNIRVAITAEVEVPEVEVKTDEVDFGAVYLGSSSSKSLAIENRSHLTAIMVLDLRKYPQFTAVVPHGLEDDEDLDQHLDEDKPMSGRPGAERVGQIYRLMIQGNSTGVIELVFSPVMLEAHAFELPLSIKGLPPSPMLRRAVVAEAAKPRVIVSTPVLDFKERVVVNERAKKFAYTMPLELTNCDDVHILWDLERGGADKSSPFGVEVQMGELEPGGTVSVNVTFCPKDSTSYSAKLHLYLDRKMEGDSYFAVELKGQGVFPCLVFDRREVILPVVPLGVTARTTLYVINQGYDNLEVTYSLPTEASRVPLSVTLPEGNMIGIAKQRLPMDIAFCSKKAMSFTARIDLMDADGKRFSVLIMGTTDNCMLSVYPFLTLKGERAVIDSEMPAKCPMLVYHEAPTELETGHSPRIEDHEPLEALLQEIHALARPETVAVLHQWVNLNFLRTPIQSIPGELRAQKGRALVEVLEMLTGKNVPRPVVGKGNLNRKEVAQNEYSAMQMLCDFLKSYGALINHVLPELLLSWDDFQRLCFSRVEPGQAQQLGSLEISAEHRAFYETNFETLSTAAWVTLLYQSVRIFCLNRVTIKSTKSLPGMGALPHGVETSVIGSNLFSVSEVVLMHWINYHSTKAWGQDANIFSDFDTGFVDGRALAALLMSHVPTLKTLGLVKKIDALMSTAEQQKQVYQNCSLVCEAMADLRLDYTLEPEDISNGTAVEMLLLALYLYQVLPQYVPKTTIHFEGRLSDTVTKLIELTNPSTKSIVYSVRLDGSPDYHVQMDEVKIEPKSKIHLGIDFVSRFTRPAEATLFLHSRKGIGGSSGATLVFRLMATVESYKISESVTVEAKLYETTSLSVPMTNPFPSDCEFQISLQEDLVEDKKKKGKGGVTNSSVVPREAFWCKRTALRVNAGESITLPMHFLPFRLSRHRCLVMFKEPDLGEFVVEVIGEVLLPNILDSVKFTTENKPTVSKDLQLPPRNALIERTRAVLMERLGAGPARDMIKGLMEPGPLTYRLEYTSPYFTGPSEVVLHPSKAGQAAAEAKPSAAKAASGRDTPPASAGPARPKPGQPDNRLMIELHPKGPGTYSTRIVLRSSVDVRVIEVESLVSAMGLRANLDFVCPARSAITQDIPIINVSTKDWVIQCHLEGAHFAGAKDMRVPAGGRINYALTFRPDWVCEVDGELSMLNTVTNDRYVYTLKGIGEDPVAEDHLVIPCRARWRNQQSIRVPNITGNDVEYSVESDLPGISGAPTLHVPQGREGEYTLTINMPRGGQYTGTVTLTAPEGKYVWYTVEVHAENPPEERVVEVTAKTRTAVAVDVTISNPMDKAVEFEVLLSGDGLLGNSVMSLGPHEEGVYELIYSPLLPGQTTGSMTFVNDEIGEFWYKLVLNATPAEPTVLPDMVAEVGKTANYMMLLENPTDEPILVTARVTNTRNYSVTMPPQGLAIAPWDQAEVPLVYTPSSLSEVEDATISFHDDVAGDWVYKVQGRGVEPSDMDQVTVTCAIGASSSNIIDFRNPFGFPITVSAALDAEEDVADVFSLLSGKTRDIVVSPFKDQQLAFMFQPRRMVDHRCTISIACPALKLTWRFPIVGVAEAPPSGTLGRFSCRAREVVKKTIDVTLTGSVMPTTEGIIDFEIVAPDNLAKIVEQSLTLSLNNSPPVPPNGVVRFDLVFQPMRAMRAKVELVVTRPSGGRWRYALELLGTEPEIDDIITIEGVLLKKCSVSFRMTNQFQAPAPFTAHFTGDSPSEFSVTPDKGVLAPYGSEGTNFVLSFAPSEYGKNYVGKLVIETEEMQWTYEVRGVHPQYQPPKAKEAKVSSKISAEVEQSMVHQKRNFMKENTKALKKR
mmetsp:Transcript_28943/g.66987  ORF Transcript_28943/g.66987 Transcript_28943/m.66987 type:complete len:2816 (+) Transcript_28943:96-8543(+)|eukprot:CAMPEP_0114547444 /NCGR_PEP_ID=MMETSP0114-20121206/4468_1 /TAXON_ID=31324 /ORGANISM="Goniomonas sp, Strain m" /LENGTH=2815 /DNA_ID=CAMNT_0001732001 /DNA_START=96 /DNA_END=8543 /DNA_ORIENTATION=+